MHCAFRPATGFFCPQCGDLSRGFRPWNTTWVAWCPDRPSSRSSSRCATLVTTHENLGHTPPGVFPRDWQCIPGQPTVGVRTL